MTTGAVTFQPMDTTDCESHLRAVVENFDRFMQDGPEHLGAVCLAVAEARHALGLPVPWEGRPRMADGWLPGPTTPDPSDDPFTARSKALARRLVAEHPHWLR